MAKFPTMSFGFIVWPAESDQPPVVMNIQAEVDDVIARFHDPNVISQDMQAFSTQFETMVCVIAHCNPLIIALNYILLDHRFVPFIVYRLRYVAAHIPGDPRPFFEAVCAM